MEPQFMGAQQVMSDATWDLALNYIDLNDKTKSTSEAVSNGIWTEILRRNFPPPKFLIAPEQRQTTGIRPDLTIFFVDKAKKEWHPVFTFEGKAPYHWKNKTITEEGKKQAAGYVKSLAWSKHKEVVEGDKFTFGIFACGKNYSILQHDVNTEEITELWNWTIATVHGQKKFDDFCKEHANSFK